MKNTALTCPARWQCLPHTMAALALCALPMAASAQTERLGQLVNGRQLVITEGKQQPRYYLVTSTESKILKRHDGKLTIGDSELEAHDVTMRLKLMQRFAVDEDSTVYASNYSVDHGLLAFRRSMNVGKWNSLVVPFELTGSQVRDAFGTDAQLAAIVGVTVGEEATVEFQTIGLDTDGVVLQSDAYYLLKPTREPDVPDGSTTSAIYGSGRVAGPVYAIPGVSLTKGSTQPAAKIYRSDDSQVSIAPRGTYRNRDGQTKVPVKTRHLFAFNNDGQFYQLYDSTAIKGFRYWFEDYSKLTDVKFRIAIDGVVEEPGVATDMAGLGADILPGRAASGEPGSVFDLSGRQVAGRRSAGGQLQRGLYIVNGKKVFIK